MKIPLKMTKLLTVSLWIEFCNEFSTSLYVHTKRKKKLHKYLKYLNKTIKPSKKQRSKTDIRYFHCQKTIEGGIFRGHDNIQKLLSDLDLGGPGDLRSNLRGRWRTIVKKLRFCTVENSNFLNFKKNF